MADTENLPDEDKRCTLFDGARRFCQRCSEFHKASEWGEHCERYLGGQPIRKCKTCGGDHPLDRWPGNCLEEPNWLESDLPVCRNFISDTISFRGVQSQLDGKMYDSKSQLRRSYRAAGVTEMGNDKAKPAGKPKPDRRKIKEAVGKAVAAVEAGARVENYVKQNGHKGMFGRVAK